MKGNALRTVPENSSFGSQSVAVKEAGDAGGDFADGAIAYEGAWLGGETFVSFDKKAVGMLSGQGEAVRVLS